MIGKRRMQEKDSTSWEDFSEDLPTPPESMPKWALKEGKHWHRLCDFDILAQAEEMTGLTLELKYESLPAAVWGIHIVRGQRGRVYINSSLSLFWRRFAIFHEVYHLLNNTKGVSFWKRTFVSMEGIEKAADNFAWAAVWPEWIEGDYSDWS
jgi:Zn-dependent peptidase ImmA (M78 family)